MNKYYCGRLFANYSVVHHIPVYKTDEVDADKAKDTARIQELEEEIKEMNRVAKVLMDGGISRDREIARLRKALIDADKVKDTARIKELEEGLRMVETWWLSSGKYASFGAPGCIFKVRELIKPKEETK